MITSNLRSNQLSADGYSWYCSYLAALDAKDVAKYSEFLADDVVMHMNNAPLVVGKSRVVAGLAAYWQTFGTLEHDLLNIYGTDSAFMLEALNHYIRADGQPVTCRAVALTDRNAGGKVVAFRLYTDVTQLFTLRSMAALAVKRIRKVVAEG